MTYKYLLIYLLFALVGCSTNSPMRTALTDMGVSSDSEYGVYGLRLQRSIDITGLGAEEVIGTITSDVDKWSIVEQLARFSPLRHDMPDNLSLRLINGQSFIVERQFESSKGSISMQDLMELNYYLTELQSLLALSVRNNVKKTIISEAISLVEKAEGDVEKNKGIADRLNIIYPDDYFDVNDLAVSLRDKYQVLNAVSYDNDVLKIKNKIKRITENGAVLITSWQRRVSAETNSNASENNANLNRDSVLGGYLILAEPRTITLYIGHDAIENDDLIESIAFNKNRNYLTHFQLRAKKVVYSELQEKILKASVKFELDSLIDLALAEELLSRSSAIRLNAEINSIYELASMTSSFGGLDANKSIVKIRDFYFNALEGFPNYRDSVLNEIKATEDTLRVISMRVAFDDKLKRSSRKN